MPEIPISCPTRIWLDPQNVAVAVNAEIALLYWNIGKRINQEVLNFNRAEYGKQIVATLSRQLTEEYGSG